MKKLHKTILLFFIILNELAHNLKVKIIKFFITKNGFFDRERLVNLSEQSLLKILSIKLYRSMLKACKIKKVKIKAPINDLERISNCYSVIGFRSKIKAFFRKKRGVKSVKTLILIG